MQEPSRVGKRKESNEDRVTIGRSCDQRWVDGVPFRNALLRMASDVRLRNASA